MKKKKINEGEGKKTFNNISPEEITDSIMLQLLIELSDTPMWKAIQRYNTIKKVDALNVLAAVDTFKEPTKAARTQGIIQALSYLENDIAREKTKRIKKETTGSTENSENEDVPQYGRF